MRIRYTSDDEKDSTFDLGLNDAAVIVKESGETIVLISNKPDDAQVELLSPEGLITILAAVLVDEGLLNMCAKHVFGESTGDIKIEQDRN